MIGHVLPEFGRIMNERSGWLSGKHCYWTIVRYQVPWDAFPCCVCCVYPHIYTHPRPHGHQHAGSSTSTSRIPSQAKRCRTWRSIRVPSSNDTLSLQFLSKQGALADSPRCLVLLGDVIVYWVVQSVKKHSSSEYHIIDEASYHPSIRWGPAVFNTPASPKCRSGCNLQVAVHRHAGIPVYGVAAVHILVQGRVCFHKVRVLPVSSTSSLSCCLPLR